MTNDSFVPSSLQFPFGRWMGEMAGGIENVRGVPLSCSLSQATVETSPHITLPLLSARVGMKSALMEAKARFIGEGNTGRAAMKLALEYVVEELLPMMTHIHDILNFPNRFATPSTPLPDGIPRFPKPIISAEMKFAAKYHGMWGRGMGLA